MFSARQTSSLSNHPSSCGGVKRRSRRWARAERCSTRSRSRCQLRSPIHTIFSMVFFSMGFDIPAIRLCGLHSVWMGAPNIQRSRIRKARRFIFFPVYESLSITSLHSDNARRPSKVSLTRRCGSGWRRLASRGWTKSCKQFLKKNSSRHILSRNPFIFVEKSTTHDTR